MHRFYSNEVFAFNFDFFPDVLEGNFSCLQVAFPLLYLSLCIYSQFGDLSLHHWLSYVKFATFYSLMDALLELFI